MKSILPILGFSFLLSSCLIAQCPTGSVTFEGQADVDQFIIDYPDCTKIDGSVIFAAYSSPYDDIEGLSNIDTVTGSMFFGEDCPIYSLAGGENIKYIGESFRMNDASALPSFEGMNNVNYIGGSFDVYELSSLISTSGFDNLQMIGNNFRLEECDNLLELSGFENLISIGGSLIIEDNNNAEEITGLTLLSSVGGQLLIDGNDSLTTILPLENLITVGNGMEIRRNISLESLMAFNALTSIGDAELNIRWNHSLTSLSGLDNIDPNSITNLVLLDSDSLSFCSVQSVCDYLNLNIGPDTIATNLMGCNTEMEITAACTPTSLEEFNNNYELSLFPNPGTDVLNLVHDIHPSEILSISISNSNGIELLKFDGAATFLNITKLSSGFYVLNIETKDHSIQQKFIK